MHLRWVLRRPIRHTHLLTVLLREVDRGEAEALLLAHESRADLLLIDKRRGREGARALGLKPLGTLGVLLLAKQRRYIEHVKPIVNDLMRHAGFWISDALYSRVMEAANEL